MSTENQKGNSPWKLGLFYYDPADPRILVPKRIPVLGWTINFANKVSWAIAFGIVVLVVWAIYTGQARFNMP